MRHTPIVALALLLSLTGAVRAANAPLADAVESQNPARIESLLAAKADVNAPQADGMTALHWAAHHDDTDLVKKLLAAGAAAKATNRYGVHALSLACTNGNEAIVAALLKTGADPNAALAGGETPLMTAARTGRLGPVQALLAAGAEVNAKEHRGQTAIMWAAADGHVEVVEALLKAGADFRAPLPSGFTPLFFAAREGRSAVIQRLLAAGADVNELLRSERRGAAPRGKLYSALLLAVESGHFELAAELLKAGADPNARPAGYTALHALTWVRKPIRGDGDPPPIGSGKLSSLDLVRAMAAHQADLNARLERGESGRGRFTTTGSTPFLLAARACDVPLVKLLLELGADPKIPNADNCSPLLATAGVGALGDGDEAAGTDEEALETARVLLAIGADVNAVDDNGESALHGAAYQSRANLVPLFAEHKADIKIWNRVNKWGWTPLMIAQGHRPGNFRPHPDSIAAIETVMRAHGLTPPKATRELPRRGYP